MNDIGLFQIVRVRCAFCGGYMDAQVPLISNVPSMTIELNRHKLIETITEAGFVSTSVGWMHHDCAEIYNGERSQA